MKEIVYSPEYLRRILELRDYLYERYGDRTADRIIKEITETVNLLKENEYLGKSLQREFGIDADYRYIFKNQNYIFYLIKDEQILVVAIYNEKENYMQKLFKVKTLTEKSYLCDY